jgi:hypothetical protein
MTPAGWHENRLARDFGTINHARDALMTLQALSRRCSATQRGAKATRQISEILVSTTFKYGRRYRQQMSDIRDRGSFARLPTMNMGRIQKCAIKPIGQDGHVGHRVVSASID